MVKDANVAGGFSGRGRRHLLIRTRNTEYQLDGQHCVAVRDLCTHELLENHPAVGRTLSGAFHLGPGGEISKVVLPDELPEIGDLLFFSDGKLETELRTSPVREICRPAQETRTQ